MSILFALAIAAAQSASGDGSNLQPASTAAILAGGKACLGATTDPAGEDVRLTGWADATPAQKGGMKTDGRVVTRDNVMLIVRTGVDGGCVIQAKTTPGFDRTAFYTDLGTTIGTPVDADQKNPVTNLANGELLVTMVKDGMAMLVFANQQGKHVKQSQGKQ